MSAGRTAVRVVSMLAAGLSLAALSGCEKPTPMVTVTSGTTSVHDEAACYARGSTPVVRADCQVAESAAPSLTLRPGSTVGISVDPELADAGWRLSINGQRATTRPITSTYYRFGLSEQAAEQGPLELQVAEVEGKALKGLWVFQLRHT